MKLVFSRHGESKANVQQVFWNRPGRFPLTPQGRKQAEALADTLAEIQFAGIYCSPVLRALETAQIVGRRFGLMPQIADGLREYSVGILEGKPYTKEREALYWRVVRQWMEADNHDARLEGGESYHDVAARFMPLIAGLEAAHRDKQANILLISHGGTLRAMLPLLLSNIDKPFAMARSVGYADPVIAEQRGGEWVCLSWGKETLL